MTTENNENENALAPTSEIVRVYNEVTSVDDTDTIAARLARLSGFVVTGDEENVKAAKKTRAALNGLANDASAARMRVQRAIKAHPIGKFAFEKTDIERKVEKESKRLGDAIARAVTAPKVRLVEEVDTYVCFVKGTLAQINKLAVYANEELGLNFENRGPVAPEGAQTQPMM